MTKSSPQPAAPRPEHPRANGAHDPHADQATPDPTLPDLAPRPDEDEATHTRRVESDLEQMIDAAKVRPSDTEGFYLLTPEQKARLAMKLPDGAIGEIQTADGEILRFVPAAVVDYLAMLIFKDQWSSEVVEISCVYQGGDHAQTSMQKHLIVRHAARVRVTVYGPDGRKQSHEAGAVSSAKAAIGNDEEYDRAWEKSYTGAITKARRQAISLFGTVFGGILTRDRDNRIQSAREEQERRRQQREAKAKAQDDGPVMPPEPPADARPAAVTRTLGPANGSSVVKAGSSLKVKGAPRVADAANTTSAPEPNGTASGRAPNGAASGNTPTDANPAAAPSASGTPGKPETRDRFALHDATGRPVAETSAEMFERGLTDRLQAAAYIDDVENLFAFNDEQVSRLPQAARDRLEALADQRCTALSGRYRPVDQAAGDAAAATDTAADATPTADPQAPAAAPEASETPADPAPAKPRGKTAAKRKPATEVTWPSKGLPDLPDPAADKNAFQTALLKAIHSAPSGKRLDELEAAKRSLVEEMMSKSSRLVIDKCFQARRADLTGEA